MALDLLHPKLLGVEPRNLDFNQLKIRACRFKQAAYGAPEFWAPATQQNYLGALENCGAPGLRSSEF